MREVWGDRSIRRPAYPAGSHGQARPLWRLGTGRETDLGQRRVPRQQAGNTTAIGTRRRMPSKTSCIQGAVQTLDPSPPKASFGRPCPWPRGYTDWCNP